MSNELVVIPDSVFVVA